MADAALMPATSHAPLTVIDRGGVQVLSIHAMQQRAALVLELMANVLEEGKDYGKIPGTDKPCLFKPGAEKACMMFQLAAERPTIDDLSSGDEIRYRVHVPIVAPDGRVLAVGIGEASSNEEKWRWRKPVCDEEWQETDAALRREKFFKKKDGGFYKGKQIRTSPADIANTVLKMAHKRGYIHGTLLATAASSVFNQDLEDFTRELQESLLEGDDAPKMETKQPQRKSQTGTGAATSKPVPADAKIVVGVIEKVVEPADKKFSTIRLKGDPRAFNAWNDSGAALIQDAKALLGHTAKLAYTESVKDGKTYQNPVGISIADAEPPKSAAPESPSQPTLVPDDYNPFDREPGQDG